MITSWWPNITFRSKISNSNSLLSFQSNATVTKVSKVGKLLHALGWASLLYTACAQRTDPFPATMKLGNLDGSDGFVINGENEGDFSSYSISSGGDINGDGFDDIVIGAVRADPLGKSSAGKSYVIFGKLGLGLGGTLNLTQVDGTNGFIMNGEQKDDDSGYSVSGEGDVNGDGFSDIIIGAPGASPIGRLSAGKTYLIFGHPQIGGNRTFELSNLNGSNGFVLNGAASGDHSGFSVDIIGDENGDGIDDIAVGAYGASPSGRTEAGKVFVIFGSLGLGRNGSFDLARMNQLEGFVINGMHPGDRFGWLVAHGGDVNGDDLQDLLIGAPSAAPDGKSDAGRTYVLLGNKNWNRTLEVDLQELDGKNGFILNGESKWDRSGRHISSCGDLNKDGFDDFMIGAYWADPLNLDFSGKTYVIFGSGSRGINKAWELSQLNRTQGFTILGAREGDKSGTVSRAGDVNVDGYDDLLVGARESTVNGKKRVGRTYLIFGKPDFGSRGTLELLKFNSSDGVIFEGDEESDDSGFSVSNAGDINGDQIDDFMIGAYGANIAGGSHYGKTYVIFGRNISKNVLMSIEYTSPPIIINTSLNSNSVSNSKGITYNPSSLRPTINTNQSTVTYVNALTFSPSKDYTPYYIGTSSGIAILACSSLACVWFYYTRKVKRLKENDPTQLQHLDTSSGGQKSNHAEQYVMQSARFDNQYDVLPSKNKSKEYKDLPKGASPTDPNHYTSIDKVEKAHDEYESAKLKKIHENYDDLPT